MTTKLEVYRGGDLLWTFTDVSEAFVLGYAYAITFGNYNQRFANQRYSAISVIKEGIQGSVYDYTWGATHNALSINLLKEDQVSRLVASNKYTKGMSMPRKYNYWIADDRIDDVYLVYDEDLEFYRGLATGARDTGKQLETIMLTWPFKDGQWYTIPGVNLKYPDEI